MPFTERLIITHYTYGIGCGQSGVAMVAELWLSVHRERCLPATATLRGPSRHHGVYSTLRWFLVLAGLFRLITFQMAWFK